MYIVYCTKFCTQKLKKTWIAECVIENVSTSWKMKDNPSILEYNTRTLTENIYKISPIIQLCPPTGPWGGAEGRVNIIQFP